MHPLLKCRKQEWFFGNLWRYWRCNDTSAPEVSQEQAGAILQIHPWAASITRASATMHQMAPKTIDKRIVQCGHGNGFTIRPINEVFRRTDVLAGSFFRVPYSVQLVSKTFKQ